MQICITAPCPVCAAVACACVSAHQHRAVALQNVFLRRTCITCAHARVVRSNAWLGWVGVQMLCVHFVTPGVSWRKVGVVRPSALMVCGISGTNAPCCSPAGVDNCRSESGSRVQVFSREWPWTLQVGSLQHAGWLTIVRCWKRESLHNLGLTPASNHCFGLKMVKAAASGEGCDVFTGTAQLHNRPIPMFAVPPSANPMHLVNVVETFIANNNTSIKKCVGLSCSIHHYEHTP